ncbi:hypothetical protein [Fischerella sp. PCC 9605]|uniref:hypothetical protein n=1 Tax=Fischerella sp. PCC 9605 TaxID=1173024 RepID=UPI00047A24B4|nr:hypothetical protein [Fischerella sp. PCC 9605]
MCVSSVRDLNVELAVDVFKTQDQALLISLKNFLTVLSDPKCLEDVLTAAIYGLSEADPDACRWILSNFSYLEPELDLVKLAKNLALTKLQNQGLVLGQDFRFESSGRLHINEKAKAELMARISPSDRLLLEEIVQICK